jgi:RNA polymerase sigma-70 factor (ECF subfamily)
MQSRDANPRPAVSIATSCSLLAGLHGNDSLAWERLISLYAPLVWNWCRKTNLPGQDVPDVVQEVFKAVATHIQCFHKDSPHDTFRGWLRTITKNKVHDYFRSLRQQPRGAGGTEAQQRWLQMADPEGSEDVDAEGLENELFHRALALIQAEFEERTWRAFWSVAVDGRSPQEAALELGMSCGAVRVAKCRVLHRLRQELGDVAS